MARLPQLFEPCSDYRFCPRIEDPDPGCDTCARQCGERACPIFVRRFQEAFGLRLSPEAQPSKEREVPR
jgi:hypothetical protein